MVGVRVFGDSMKIAVIGTGYVGLVTGTCFADSGNDVTCVDIDQAKIERLKQGQDSDLRARAWRSWSCTMSQPAGCRSRPTWPTAVRAGPDRYFIAVGTPQADDGCGRPVGACGRWSISIAPHLIARMPSWSPRARCRWAPTPASYARLKELTGRDCRRGQQSRVPQGRRGDRRLHEARPRRGRRARGRKSADVLHELYEPFLRTEQPFLVMSPESAEMTKYVANALLATKISFINEMANLCERMAGRHQRRPPRHRPRQPDRLRVSVSRRRLRRQLLSQGRAGARGHGRGACGVEPRMLRGRR